MHSTEKFVAEQCRNRLFLLHENINFRDAPSASMQKTAVLAAVRVTMWGCSALKATWVQCCGTKVRCFGALAISVHASFKPLKAVSQSTSRPFANGNG
jgi:hypothetical protein